MPNPDLEITGWPGHPDPEIRKRGGGGTVSKNFFRPLGPQFGLKIRRGALHRNLIDQSAQ